jgi:hypothetical protein
MRVKRGRRVNKVSELQYAYMRMAGGTSSIRKRATM